MSVVNSIGNVVDLQKIHAFVSWIVQKKAVSKLHERDAFLAYLTGRLRSDTFLGRPGALGLIGGSGQFGQVQKANEIDSEIKIFVQKGRTQAGKQMAVRDSMPTVGQSPQHDNFRTATWKYTTDIIEPIEIVGHYMRLNKGPQKLLDLVRMSTEQAMEDANDKLSWKLRRGAPSDQQAELWDDLHGVVHIMNSTNTYGNIDRSSSTYTDAETGESINYWAGNRVTSSVTAGIDLIDEAMYTHTLARRMNRAPDLWLCGEAVFLSIKREALARGGNAVTTEIPEFSKLGVEFDAVRYGRSTIVCDTKLRGNWSSQDGDITDATKLVMGLNTEDMIFSTLPTGNWTTGEFFDNSKIKGGSDSTSSYIRVSPRLRNEKPWNSILYTNVNA